MDVHDEPSIDSSESWRHVPGPFAMPTSTGTLLALFMCGVASCGTDAAETDSETATDGILQIDDRHDTLEAERQREVARRGLRGDPPAVAVGQAGTRVAKAAHGPVEFAKIDVRRLDDRVEVAVDELSRKGRLVREDLAEELSRTRLDVQRALSQLEELNERPTEQARDGFDAALVDFERQVIALERDADRPS